MRQPQAYQKSRKNWLFKWQFTHLLTSQNARSQQKWPPHKAQPTQPLQQLLIAPALRQKSFAHKNATANAKKPSAALRPAQQSTPRPPPTPRPSPRAAILSTFATKRTNRKAQKMRLSIASDHAGFEQKQALAAYLTSAGHTVTDFGPQDDNRVDYPDFAALVANSVADGSAEFGVLVCGTGIGMAIAANKIHGVRAVNIINQQFAQLSREHNNANVITLSGRFVDLEENKRILDTFLNEPFGEGRHAARVEKIMALEN
jgi:ribose 5-phosphate isomerase B